jgi:hypothetical protein
LARIGGETTQDCRRRNGSGLDRSRQAQDLVPIFGDDAQVDNAPDQRIEGPIIRAGSGDIEPAVGEVANARREAESQEVAEAEHVIDGASRVGVVLTDIERAFVVHEAVENMGGLAGVGGDDLGIERRVAVGDMGVELYPRLGAVFGVVVGARLPVPAGAEELAIRR